MKKIAFILAFCIACVYAHAETILLRTGARVQGTIVFQNEEVVIIRNAEGARFQYPRADVEAVLSDEEAGSESSEASDQPEETDIRTSKKAHILLELAGGAAVDPGAAAGGAFSVDLLIGSHHIKNKHVFVGGGVGYHGLFLGGAKYNFLPVMAAVRMPFIEAKHAPVFGASIGYGIALSKNYTGGIYAGVDLGYRCQLNPKTALALVGFVQFQQAKFDVTVTPDELQPKASYVNKTWQNLVVAGLKFALYF